MDLDPVGTLMAWISAYGFIGLFAVALTERFVPLVPSCGLLLAVGIAASDGSWSLPVAFLATTTGSVMGCAACFYAVRRLDHARSMRLLNRAGQLFGISTDRTARWFASFRINQTVLAFSLQLVPTVRLFAPAFAGLLRGRSQSFLAASAAGIAIWNGLFIGIGYQASRSIDTANTTILFLAVLSCLIAVEVALLWIARRIRIRRRQASGAMRHLIAAGSGAQPVAASSPCKPYSGSIPLKHQGMPDALGFFHAWIQNPLRVAAIVPSGRALADLITSEISCHTGPIIELGPGTGAFTRALIARGVLEEDLALIEFGSGFAAALHSRYPQAHTLCMDATRLRTVDLFDGRLAGAVVSGLPLLSMPPRKVMAILSGAFGKMEAGGALYQFTYGPSCPVPRRLLDRLGLVAERIGGTLANFPPAAVYRLRRNIPEALFHSVREPTHHVFRQASNPILSGE
jgi:phosphatidylethanolamine/phosphatidyl-N-methylethanolamine N-methyltransferase